MAEYKTAASSTGKSAEKRAREQRGAVTPSTVLDDFREHGHGLVYGLGIARGPYRAMLDEEAGNTGRELTPFIIDTYTNLVSQKIIETSASNRQINQQFIELHYNGEPQAAAKIEQEKKLLRALRIPENLQGEVEPLHPSLHWQSYFEVGRENNKFNFRDIYRKAAEKYRNEGPYKFPIQGRSIVPVLLWKRASKSGIEMAARKVFNIFFVLDLIDLPAVVNKEGDKGQGITASELRYAYRNRDRLQGQLFFYRDKKRVPAPWDDDPVLWKNRRIRARHRARNIFGKLTR